MLERLRAQRPLIHCITNAVTIEGCANLLHACGGAPVMADDPHEAAEITSSCAGLTLNLGTISPSKAEAMRYSGKAANARGLPVLLDPVGVGASAYRREIARGLLRDIRFTAIRGNLSEIRALVTGAAGERGVDADTADLSDAPALAQVLSRETGSLVCVTGQTDVLCDGTRARRIHGGTPMLSRITGSGCMLSAMATAYLAANPDTPFDAMTAAVCALKLCGERAAAYAPGCGSFRVALLDEIGNLIPSLLESGAVFEELDPFGEG
jgi:hydroxyethylthiazole kinase